MSALTAELRPHPRTPCDAVRRVGIAIDPDDWPRALRFHFRVDGDMGRIRLPASGFARRSDGLWQHTCFEAFLRPHASDSYHEFNFAPSGDWAAYRFGGRRSGRSLPALPAPVMAFRAERDRCDLSAELDISALPEICGAAFLRTGIAAVIEQDEGVLAYWALAHGSDGPDFHDPAGFALRVGPA
jgi:hypothetical protein